MDEKKEKTAKFRPVRETGNEDIHRPLENRDDDIYSEGRKQRYSDEYYEDKKSGKALVYTAVVLGLCVAVLLGIGVYMIFGNNGTTQLLPEDEITETETEKEEPEEEEPQEEVAEINGYEMIFNVDDVVRRNGYYTFICDLYSDNGKSTTRKIKVDDKTDIRENGKRINVAGFIYTMQNAGGDMPVVMGKINEDENYAISLSYRAEEIVKEEPEEPKKEENAEKEPESTPGESGKQEETPVPETQSNIPEE